MTSSKEFFQNVILVGKLREHFEGLSIEKLTITGAWVLNRETLENGFMPFPYEKMIQHSMKILDPRDPLKTTDVVRVLMQLDDWGVASVMEEMRQELEKTRG